jgi:hypothetical protein
METPSEPKPKRKYVMTPEHRAKVMANLAQARRAPKEKVYRKTPKRYAANLSNLAKANAAVRQQAEERRAKLEDFFPAPEVPPPVAPSSGRPSGADELDEAAALIGKRLRKIHAARRREGRRIMRLLTAAISRSHPLSAAEACQLVRALLACLDGSRVVAEVRRLNQKIADLLLKMLAARYGAEAQVDGVPLAEVLEHAEEQRRQRAARGEARGAGAAGKGSPAASGETPAGGAEGDREGGNGQPEASGGQDNKPSCVYVPPLPKTAEEFLGLLARALDLEGEGETKHLLVMLVAPLWDRLHWWEAREKEERQRLEELFQEGAATPPGSFDDLLNRMFDLNFFLGVEGTFVGRMNLPTDGIENYLEQWLEWRVRIIERRGRKMAVPAKRPVSTAPDQSMSGSADPSAA